MKNIYTLLVLLVVSAGSAQQNVKLKIDHFLGNQPFAMQQTATNNLGHSFDVGRLQYYLSGFSVIHDGNQTTTVTGVYALVDASVSTVIDLGSLAVTNVEGIKFHVGVHTPENNQDPAQWPASHPLSPKNPSMHWGWASGYFFIAMGGNAGSSLNQVYELHGLGNTNYFSQTVNTGASMVGSDLVITINADYTEALRNITVSGGVVSHGSTGDAATAIANFRDHVFSGPASTTGIKAYSTTERILVYPNPSLNGKFSVNTAALPVNSDFFRIVDVTGRVVMEQEVNSTSAPNIDLDKTGIYFFQLHSSDGSVETIKIVALSE